MNQPTHIDSSWDSCPRGTLKQLGRRARSQRRQWRAFRVTAAAVAIFLVVGYSYRALAPHLHEPSYGGITCTQVAQRMPAYREGTLDRELVVKIETHLDQCPDCRRFATGCIEDPGLTLVQLSRCDCHSCQEPRPAAPITATHAAPMIPIALIARR